MLDNFNRNDENIKRQNFLRNIECLKIAKLLTSISGQPIKPETEKLFMEASIERANDYINILLDNVASKLSNKEETQKIDFLKAIENVISNIDSASNECKAWISRLDNKVIYALQKTLNVNKSLSNFSTSEIKTYPTITAEALEKLYMKNHYTESLGYYLERVSNISNDLYDKAFINKYIDFIDYNMMVNNLLCDCNDGYEDVYSIKYKEGKPKKLKASILENERAYIDLLNSYGYSVTDINQFYLKFIKGLKGNLIETNYILKCLNNSIRFELNEKVSEELTKKFASKMRINKNQNRVVADERSEMFRENIESINFDVAQCKLMLENGKTLDIDFLYRILNQPSVIHIKRNLNTLIYLKGKSVEDICRVDSGIVKMQMDDLCYKYFMTEKERKVINKNLVQIGTYDEYVPQAHERMLKFTSKLA